MIGLLVDEMLVYAGAPHGLWGMTAKVRYWVRKPIPLERRSPCACAGAWCSTATAGSAPSCRSTCEGDVLAAEGEGMCVLRRPAPV